MALPAIRSGSPGWIQRAGSKYSQLFTILKEDPSWQLLTAPYPDSTPHTPLPPKAAGRDAQELLSEGIFQDMETCVAHIQGWLEVPEGSFPLKKPPTNGEWRVRG